MRKTILVAPKNSCLFNGFTYPCCAQKPHFSTPIQRRHLHQHSFDGPITPQDLIDLLQESTRVQSIITTKAIHALTIRIGPKPKDPVLLYNNIISKYASLGEIFGARHLFDKMPQRNVVSYNCMIKAYSRDGNFEEAWKLFSGMRNSGFHPTEFTLGSILSSSLISLLQGLQLLAFILKSGFLYVDAFVGTALLGMFEPGAGIDAHVIALIALAAGRI